jgi:hypothetical protein
VDLAKDWNSVKVLEAVRDGMLMIDALRQTKIEAGQINSSVTIAEVAHLQIVIEAWPTSKLFAYSDTSIDQDLLEVQKALNTLGYKQLRPVFALDRKRNTAVMVFLPLS